VRALAGCPGDGCDHEEKPHQTQNGAFVVVLDFVEEVLDAQEERHCAQEERLQELNRALDDKAEVNSRA
jgi:hypothetical protein